MGFTKKILSLIESEEDKKAKKGDDRYEYGCAMVYFDFPEMKKLHFQIEKDEIYSPEGGGYGLETEPHVTLLFGLHSDEIHDETILDICSLRDYSDLTLNNVSLFKNDGFEVLKFDVHGEDLYHVNKILTELPHTSTYPNYHPHTTIAYLKPGTGDEVVKRLKVKKPYKVESTKIIYSKPDKSKVTKKINHKKSGAD